MNDDALAQRRRLHLNRRRMLQASLAASVCAHIQSSQARATDPRKLPPQPGDDVVFPSWENDGRRVCVADVPLAGPPILAYPADPENGVRREKSRLNQLLVARFEVAELDEKTALASAGGIVAYSGVCTHTGCSVDEWDTESRNFLCPCHGSQFDPRNSAQVIGGPATRPLAILPLQRVGEQLSVRGPFAGKLGAKKK